MTNKELIKIAYDLGADLNSVGAMVNALRKGIEIGRAETIEKACDALCKSQCGKITNSCQECGKYKVFRKAIEEE